MKKYAYLVVSCLMVVMAVIFSINATSEKTNTQIKAQQAAPTISVVAKGLTIPWALAFLPDGNIFMTQRNGKIMTLNPNNGLLTTVTTITGVKEQAESGLLGAAIHPQFNTNHWVYVYYSYQGTNGTENRVVRYEFLNNQLSTPTVLIDAIPGNDYHDGGRMKFGPDGFLYITTGDATVDSSAQDPNSLSGKILRVTDDGTAAPGNPFNNRTWSYGHRNPQGITWDGTTMYETEHGPSNPSCCDEINRIEPGKNYGWPTIRGDQTAAGMEKNLVNSGQDGNNTWAPSGTTFYNGSIFFAGLRGEALYEAKVNGTTATIVNQYFKHQLGRIRDVVVGPDNFLYIATNNKSAQGGTAQPEDDKVLKVAFPGQIAPTTAPTPTMIMPTYACISGTPCASPDPTNRPGGGVPITPGTGTTPGTTTPGATTPGAGGTNPQPTSTQPCETTNSALHNDGKKHKKYRRNNSGGFLQQLIEFLLKFIMFLLEKLGVQFPTGPTGPGAGNPCPQPTTSVVMPTTQPTQGAGPSAVPTLAADSTPHLPLPSGPFKTCRPSITVDTTAAPDLDTWMRTVIVPRLQAWYPYISDVIASPDYSPRCDLSIKAVVDLGVPGNASFETGLIQIDVADARAHMTDNIGMYIHESTHVIQSYANGRPEGWIIEGIADWMRDYIYKDRTTQATANVYFIDGYSEAGFLLQHINTKYDPQFVHKLNVAAHNGTYNFDIFYKTTGKYPDQLWTDATGFHVPAGEIKSTTSKCVDITNGVTVDGTLIQIADCNGQDKQRWSIAPSRVSALQKRLTARGKCLDVQDSGTADGTPVRLWSCNGSVAQEWTPQANGTILNPNANKCLAIGANGTSLDISTCNTSAQQVWTMPL